MTQERRDALLKLMLPGLVAIVVYVFVLARGLHAEVRKAEAALAQARKEAPPQAEVGREMARIAALPAEIDRRRALCARLSERLGVGAGEADHGARTAAAAWFTGILSEHGLALVEETVEPVGAGTAIPSAIRARALAPDAGPGLRALRFRGRYLDALGALERLAASDRPIFPISLSTARDELGLGLLNFRLVIWI